MTTFNTLLEVLVFLNSKDFHSVTVNGEVADGFWARNDDNALMCGSDFCTVATHAPFDVDYELENDDFYSNNCDYNG
tara:strand:+ start:476 stop:706 length:231 start_codon:yes stop_codon:yes gene_type:complete